jgi:hypothetical protein
MEMPIAMILSSQLRFVEREGRPQEIAAFCNLACLSPFDQSIFFKSRFP